MIKIFHQLRARKRIEDRLIEIAMRGYKPEVVEKDWFYHTPDSLLKKCFDNNKIVRRILGRWIHYREIRKRQKRVVAIWQAFKDVKLGDGIGMYEADCIDEYLEPNDPLYIKARSEDEREDWLNVYDIIKDGNYRSVSSFMDAKGLLFHLPALILIQKGRLEDDYSVFEFKFLHLMEVVKGECEYENVENSNFVAMVKMLTPQQKKVILDEYEFMIDYNNFVNRKQIRCTDEIVEEYFCNCCKNMHKVYKEFEMTLEEKIAEIEASEYYIVWKFLQKYFKQ